MPLALHVLRSSLTHISLGKFLGSAFIAYANHSIRVFGGPTIIGVFATALFWYLYKDIDKEEYRLAHNEDFQKEFQAVHHIDEEKVAK
jgi:hypothetical protein